MQVFTRFVVLFFLVHELNLVSSANSTRGTKRQLRSTQKVQQQSTFCPSGRKEGVVYTLKPFQRFAEVSYMAYSTRTRKGKSVVWMGSDGFQNSISAVNVEDGKIINTYKLDVPPQAQGDWESMSIGPCDSKGTKSCIYIGNTGNNLAEFCLDQNCHTGRPLVYIYKLEEPDINAFNDLNSSLQVATLVVNFKKSGFPTNRANSESLFVDHAGDEAGGKAGDLYFITKFETRRDLQRVVKISVDSHGNLSPGSSSNVPFAAVGKVSQDATWTDATMNRKGNLIAVRSWNKIFFYPRDESQTVEDALEGMACPFVSSTVMRKSQDQFESVTFMPFPYYAEASECLSKKACELTITRYELSFD